MSVKAHSPSLDRVSHAGAVVLAFVVFGVIAVKVALWQGFPADALSRMMLALSAGYLVRNIAPSRSIVLGFGLLCIACGLWLVWAVPFYRWLGALVAGCGLLVTWTAPLDGSAAAE